MQPVSNFFKKEYNYKAKRLSPNVVKAKHIQMVHQNVNSIMNRTQSNTELAK